MMMWLRQVYSVFVPGLVVIILMGVSDRWAFPADRLPAGFAEVNQAIPSIVFDIRYAGLHNFVGERIDGYKAPKCILTRKAVDALAGVQKDLKKFSLSLKVYDCYRPQRAVDHFVRWAKDTGDTKMKKEFYPAVDKKNLFRDGYIAAKSGHSRGSTVDLTLVPLSVPAEETYLPGQNMRACYLPADQRFGDNSVDMGTGYDCFDELAHPANGRIGMQQRMNRLLLKALMEKHGFTYYDKEWWHFTLKGEPFPDTLFDFPVE
jgi:D-alanyl-D-alanine dipeptidase